MDKAHSYHSMVFIYKSLFSNLMQFKQELRKHMVLIRQNAFALLKDTCVYDGSANYRIVVHFLTKTSESADI